MKGSQAKGFLRVGRGERGVGRGAFFFFWGRGGGGVS